MNSVDLKNEVTTRLLYDEDEIKEFDIKYKSFINTEYKDDFVDINAILDYTNNNTDYEIYLKGFYIFGEYDDTGHNISVVWGMSDKAKNLTDFDNYTQDIARVIVKDVVESLLSKLENYVKEEVGSESGNISG